MVFSTTFSMPSFLSTTATMARLAIASSIQGTHQLALRRMSEKVLLGATKVSTTRSAWERGGGSRGATELAELMRLLLLRTKALNPGCAKARTNQPQIKLESGQNSARLYHWDDSGGERWNSWRR